MITVCISNQKGGVAKTTTAHAMASGLAKRGYKVLAIDCDPQCDFSFISGIDVLGTHSTLYDLFERTVEAENVLQRTKFGYDMIPGDLRLTIADLQYSAKACREYMLSRAIEGIANNYDYCIVDTAPYIGLLVMNVIAITDKIIVPLTADAFAVKGLSFYLRLLNDMRKELMNPRYKVEGLLITRYEINNLNKNMTEEIRSIATRINTKAFNTIIRNTVEVGKAQLKQEATDNRTTAGQDYEAFIDEFLKGGNE